MAERASGGARRGWLRGLLASVAVSVPHGGAAGARGSPARAGPAGVADVRDFGAVGDGVSDDTAAIQAAIDAGACVRIPAGTYRVGRLSLRSHVSIVGDGAASVLQGSPGTTMLHALSASPAVPIENVELRGLRLSGAVTRAGFSEHVHLLAVAGVRNLLVERVQFVGFQGDGLYLGANLDNSRHNAAVRVLDCLFDGVNKDNRNCISVIDGDGVIVRGCVFRRSSRRDMPGFIDVEPNDPANVVRNIQITGNHFEDTDGAIGAISFVVLKPRLKVPPETFVVSHNTFDTTIRMVSLRIGADYGVRQNVVVTGNSGRVASVGDFYPVVRGLVIGQNTLSVTGPAALGHAATDSVVDVAVVGNAIDGGDVARGAFDIRCGSDHVVSGNLFTHHVRYALLCGMQGGALSNVSILGNRFRRCGPHAVVSAGRIEGESCRFLDNAIDASHLFPAWITDDTGAVTNGSVAPATFNLSTPAGRFTRPGVHRSAIEGDRAAPDGLGSEGLLETRVQVPRQGRAWVAQWYHPAHDGSTPGLPCYSRVADRSGKWSHWVRHAGVRID